MVGSPLQHTIYAYSQSPCQFSKCTKSVHLLIDSQSRYCSLVKEQSSLHTQHVNREPFILKSLKRPWCQISTILVSRYSCKRHARSTVIPALSSCSSNRGYPDSIHRTHSSRSSSRAWTHMHTGSPFHRSASELYQSSPSVERLVHTWWRIELKAEARSWRRHCSTRRHKR